MGSIYDDHQGQYIFGKSGKQNKSCVCLFNVFTIAFPVNVIPTRMNILLCCLIHLLGTSLRPTHNYPYGVMIKHKILILCTVMDVAQSFTLSVFLPKKTHLALALARVAFHWFHLLQFDLLDIYGHLLRSCASYL